MKNLVSPMRELISFFKTLLFIGMISLLQFMEYIERLRHPERFRPDGIRKGIFGDDER